MRMRGLLLATAAGILWSVSAGAAFASAPQTLQPDGNWAVSRVAAQDAGGTPYCALARRYSNDIVLTIARNGNGETSVAIDFQKNTLDKNADYDVTLFPDTPSESSYGVRPVSGKAVVLRLGRDATFDETLAQTGGMGIQIGDGKNYAFNMPDIARGQSEMGGCLASLAEPAAGDTEAPPAPLTPAAGSLAEPAAISAATEAPLREIDALREENNRLRGALERERRDFENRFMQQSGTSSMTAELNEKIRLLESENDSLKQRVATLPAAAAPVPLQATLPSCPEPDRSALESMEHEMALLREENGRLKKGTGNGETNSQAAAQSMAAELTALRDENTHLRRDVESLNLKLAELDNRAAEALKSESHIQKEIDSEAVATIGRLQSRVEILEAENAGLRESLRTAENRAAEARTAQEGVITLSQLRSVEEQLRIVESERDRLKGEMAALHEGGSDNGRTEKTVSGIASADWNLEIATRRFNEAEREIRRLGGQLEQQRSQCAVEKKEIEYMLFDPQIATQEQIATLTRLERELAEARAKSEVSATGYEKKIEALHAELAAKESEIAAVREKKEVVAQIRPAPAPAAYTAAPLQEQAPTAQERAASRADAVSVSRYEPAAGDSRAPSVSAPAPSLPPATADSIVRILEVAGIGIDEPLKQLRDSSGNSGYDAFSWKTEGLFGSADVRTVTVSDSFDSLVRHYLDRTQKRCAGDFASVPVEGAATAPVAAYEIACVGGDESATAALVFFMRDGRFTAIAHEAPVANMDTAMDVRDRILSALQTPDRLAAR